MPIFNFFSGKVHFYGMSSVPTYCKKKNIESYNAIREMNSAF